jgi:acetylornithine deacetylase/succinyl-diaminopimelate desuccinylase-like protein
MRESEAEHRVQERLSKDFDSAIEDIRSAIRIPGVSKTGERLDEMAAWTVDYLRALGAQVRLTPGKIAPIIEANLRSPEATRTLLFYTLYDVQPAYPAQWSSPPFDPQFVTDARGHQQLIGRGAFNSKGPLVGFLAVLKAFRDAGVPLPVNLVLVIEGEEEIGSPSLEPYIRSNRERLRQCDAAFIPYLGTNSKGETPIRLGFKGLGFIDLTVEGGEWGGPARHDVHAMHSGWLGSPAWELLGALSTLHRDSVLAIDDLPAPPPPTEADRALIREAAKTLSPDTFLNELGARRFKFDGDFETTLTHFLFDPTLNIDALWIGNVPPGTEPPTNLLRKAQAVLDLRFVPGMDIAETERLIRRHLDARGYAHVAMKLRKAYPASKCDADEPVVQALIAACRQHSDKITVFPIHAGAAPLYLFADVLGLPFAFGGLGHGGRPHAPDEYIAVDSMRDYLRSMTSFLFGFGASARGATA